MFCEDDSGVVLRTLDMHKQCCERDPMLPRICGVKQLSLEFTEVFQHSQQFFCTYHALHFVGSCSVRDETYSAVNSGELPMC